MSILRDIRLRFPLLRLFQRNKNRETFQYVVYIIAVLGCLTAQLEFGHRRVARMLRKLTDSSSSPAHH